ncbi:MAG TPA: type II secretion system F family protein [Polyangiaceae bacterium]|nr:type II secretion system F family protein [Polyangiaceae bacterium]
MSGLNSSLLAYGGNGLVVLGALLIVRAVLSGDTLLTRYCRRYTGYLERSLHLLFLRGSGSRILSAQVACAVPCLLAGLWLDPWCFGLLALCAVGPHLYLSRKRQQHVRKLEGQMDALMVAFANALKTVPSPAAALAQVVVVLPDPMRLEIDRLLREMRVGGTLEQGLLNMSARLKSPELDSALSAVLIGIQVGGNLATVLESTGATLREMSRLEGVVRTKTSEGRAQLWVLGVFPFAICLALKLVDPDYFNPLQTTTIGGIVTTVAVLLWLVSLVTARKIMQVDI